MSQNPNLKGKKQRKILTSFAYVYFLWHFFFFHVFARWNLKFCCVICIWSENNVRIHLQLTQGWTIFFFLLSFALSSKSSIFCCYGYFDLLLLVGSPATQVHNSSKWFFRLIAHFLCLSPVTVRRHPWRISGGWWWWWWSLHLCSIASSWWPHIVDDILVLKLILWVPWSAKLFSFFGNFNCCNSACNSTSHTLPTHPY